MRHRNNHIGLGVKTNDWDLVEFIGTVYSTDEEGSFIDGFQVGGRRTFSCRRCGDPIEAGPPICHSCSFLAKQLRESTASEYWARAAINRQNRERHHAARQEAIELARRAFGSEFQPEPRGGVPKPFPEFRTCSKCMIAKPITDFALTGNKKYGNSLSSRCTTCKQCRTQLMKARYHRLANSGQFISRKSTKRGTGCNIRPLERNEYPRRNAEERWSKVASSAWLLTLETLEYAIVKHGRSRYQKNGCRCDVCRTAMRHVWKLKAERRLTRRPSMFGNALPAYSFPRIYGC